MPTVGNPIFNWSAPCLEQELIRWEDVVDDNFRVNKTENEVKAALIRGWIGDKGTQYLHKYKWTRDEWQNHELIMERLKEKIQPKGRNQRNKYKSDLDHFRQTTESFSEFWTELKRKVELAKNKSTRCKDHKDCSSCLDGYMEEELMSLIYNRVSDQRTRDCIDMLPDAEHTLEKYLHLGETQELSEANAAASNPQPPTAPVHALRYKGKSQGKSTGKLCSSCGYKHKYGECKAKGEKCKKCSKIGHFARVCRSKCVNNSQCRSNNKSARFSGTRKVHMVTDNGEIQGKADLNTATERLEDVISCEFVDPIDVLVDEDTTSQPKGNMDVHTGHKPMRYQAFTRVSMYPTDTSGKSAGKPIEMKCKLDTGASVNVMPLAAYKLIKPSELDQDNKPIGGFGQDRTTLRGYSGNIIKQYGTRLIKAFWNNKYWAILFHIVETQGPILLGLNAMRKFGLFTKHPRISIETVDLLASKQNLTRCEGKEATARQGAAGPAAEIQCYRLADYTQIPAGRGYVNQKHINNKISAFILEGWSSAVSLQNRQLRTTLPATKLQTNSETVKVSPQTRKKHSRYDAHTKELPRLLPKQSVRLQDPSTKKWSIPGEVLQKAETPNSYVVKTPKGVLRNRIHIKEAAMPGPQVPTKQAPAAASMAPRQLISKITQSAKTIEKPRAAAMPPNESQPVLPTPVPPSPQGIPSVPKPHPVIQENDRPHNSTGSGDNNKASPKVSVSKPPGPVQVPDKPQDTTKETTTLCRSNKVRKPNKRHADTLKVASEFKNNPWLWSKTPPKGTVHMF